MNYFVCFVWRNLRGNHAGIPHMCDMIHKMDPRNTKVIHKYEYLDKTYLKSKYFNTILNRRRRHIESVCFEKSIQSMLSSLSANDTVFLFEYLLPPDQFELAKKIREKSPQTKIVTLTHLGPSRLLSFLSVDDILSQFSCADTVLTMGTSLARQYAEWGVPESKIKTIYHPIDTNYFNIKRKSEKRDKFNVLVAGNLQRDYSTLEEIVKQTPNICYTICAGVRDASQFSKYKNVVVRGFLPEKELLEEFQNADVSLNVMEDTIGSNIITISMAMGLAMIVSDVGSIRDYCTEDDAIFCKTPKDFVNALNVLANNYEKLNALKANAHKRSRLYTIQNFYNNIV